MCYRASKLLPTLLALALTFVGPVARALASTPAPTPAPAVAAPVPDMLPVLLALVLVLIGARLGGALFERLGQPPVLGELFAGVVIGNLGLFGWHGLDGLRDLPALEILAQIGVLFLLFEVGLSSDAGRLLAVGWSSLLVATLGVAAPIGLGFAVSWFFFPGLHPLSHWFVGATLCATSVGITARVLRDLGFTGSREGRIILGAAVIDDVMGLVVLAVVTGVVAAIAGGAAFRPASGLAIVGKAIGFLAVAFVIGRVVSRRVFALGARLRGAGVLLSLALAFCFGLAWLAGALGLAPIVGAFAAGLVLDEAHYRDLRARDPAGREISDLLEPLTTFLVPVFFVLLGMRVDLAVFGERATLGFALALIVTAVLSKQACSLGVLERGTDRLAVGLGMIPRGEVGLIFASLGTTLVLGGERLVNATMFSAIVAMVAATTLLTPPLLAWRLKRLPGSTGTAPEVTP
jgi:Kef-type K+ transport system membrane component KefB